jgi:hypothetical protein
MSSAALGVDCGRTGVGVASPTPMVDGAKAQYEIGCTAGQANGVSAACRTLISSFKET